MRRYCFSLAFVMAIIAAALPPVSALADDKPQGIVYEAKWKRLHTVASDLAKSTGVDIYCGSTSSDWQVRDIPVTIAVKSVELEPLLQLVAEATHTTVKKTMVGDSKKAIYRFIRTKKQNDDIAGPVQRLEEARLERWSKMWDSLVKLGDYGSELKLEEDSLPRNISNEGLEYLKSEMLRLNALKPLGKLLKKLGPEARTNVLAGDTVIISSDTLENSQLLSKLEELIRMDSDNQDSDLPAQASPLELVISVRDRSEQSSASLTAVLYQLTANNLVKSRQSVDLPMILDSLKYMKDFGSSTANEPKSDADTGPERFTPEYDLKGMSRKFLISDEDWAQPVMQKKLKLNLPQDRTNLTISDYLLELSKASGFSIICDNFKDHLRRYPKAYWRQELDGLRGPSETEVTFGHLLRLIGGIGWWWAIDERSGLIFGCSADWRSLHSNLAPESLFVTTRTKLRTTGLELDHVTHLMNLTPEQFRIWFGCGDDGDVLDRAYQCTGKLLWQIYDCLSPADKMRAKSEDGFNLSGVNADWLEQTIREQSREIAVELSRPIAHQDGSLSQGDIGNYERNLAHLLKDPRAFASLTMRVHCVKMNDYGGLGAEPDKSLRDRYTYYMTIENSANADNERLSLNIKGPGVVFPVLSKQRKSNVDVGK